MNTALTDLYIQETLANGKAPENVFQFAKLAGIEEAAFYDEYASLEALGKSIFTSWWQDMHTAASQDELFKDYSAREKVLSLFFGWVALLKKQRSFVLLNADKSNFPPQPVPAFLKNMKPHFIEALNPILQEAMATKEVETRKFFDDKYAEALWIDFVFVNQFWIKDQSKGFEKTDEAIEKSINLAFDLMGKSALDNALEFGKFLFQNK